MKTNNFLSKTHRLFSAIVLMSLLVSPALTMGSDGKHKPKAKNHDSIQSEAEYCQQMKQSLNCKAGSLVYFEDVAVAEEETRIENWMKDIHDPFWQELLAPYTEEQGIEAWMFNPADWH
jgi:hypothetical protein